MCVGLKAVLALVTLKRVSNGNNMEKEDEPIFANCPLQPGWNVSDINSKCLSIPISISCVYVSWRQLTGFWRAPNYWRSRWSKIFWSLVRGLDGRCEEVEQLGRLRGAGTPSGWRSALTPLFSPPHTPLCTTLTLYPLHPSYTSYPPYCTAYIPLYAPLTQI